MHNRVQGDMTYLAHPEFISVSMQIATKQVVLCCFLCVTVNGNLPQAVTDCYRSTYPHAQRTQPARRFNPIYGLCTLHKSAVPSMLCQNIWVFIKVDKH